MSKIVKNTTGSILEFSDIGISISANSQITVNSQDYLLWANSSDAVTHIGSGDAVVNDGSNDLNISDGIDLIKGLYPKSISVNNTDSSALPIKFSHHSVDVFDRLVVSQENCIWSHGHVYVDDIDDYFDKYTSSGTGTFTHLSDESMMKLTNSSGSSDVIEYRTYRYFEYLKGREQTYMFTANPKGLQSGTIKRFGAFDDKNGMFFELSDSTAHVVLRSSVTGTKVDTKVQSSQWNHDIMDGTGDSGVTIDWSTVNLFYIKYSWLGSNIIEFGIYYNGKKTPMHRINTSNSLGSLYSQQGNLPISVSLENTSAVSPAPEFKLGCVSVFTGGNVEVFGEVFDVSTGTDEITVSTTEQVIASIRMQSSKNRASIKGEEFCLISPSGNSTVYYEISIDTTFTGDSWSPVPSSLCEYLTSHSSYSKGRVLYSGYIKAGGEAISIDKILSDLYVGRKIDGSSQTLTITAQTFNSTAKLVFSGRYREYK